MVTFRRKCSAPLEEEGRLSRDRIVIAFAIICTISAYLHYK